MLAGTDGKITLTDFKYRFAVPHKVLTELHSWMVHNVLTERPGCQCTAVPTLWSEGCQPPLCEPEQTTCIGNPL